MDGVCAYEWGLCGWVLVGTFACVLGGEDGDGGEKGL